MKPNRMKAKLQAGQLALGCSVMFPSAPIVEMVGYAGFDWVPLDCEHGSLSLADVELMAVAADAARQPCRGCAPGGCCGEVRSGSRPRAGASAFLKAAQG
jgi:hypothetical protein